MLDLKTDFVNADEAVSHVVIPLSMISSTGINDQKRSILKEMMGLDPFKNTPNCLPVEDIRSSYVHGKPNDIGVNVYLQSMILQATKAAGWLNDKIDSGVKAGLVSYLERLLSDGGKIQISAFDSKGIETIERILYADRPAA